MRVFGGQVAGPGAGRRRPHRARRNARCTRCTRTSSGPATRSVPIVYEVDRIRDGRSFTTRRVVAVQHGKAIFALSASFQQDEQGIDHAEPMPDVPDPESLPTCAETRPKDYRDARHDADQCPRPIDVRYVTEPPWESARGRSGRGPQPGVDAGRRQAAGRSELLHVCVLTYASDMTLLDAVLAAARRLLGPRQGPGREPGPRAVVPPAVPGRRVVPVRHRFADGLGGSRAGHRAVLHPGRHAGRHRGAGGADPGDQAVRR